MVSASLIPHTLSTQTENNYTDNRIIESDTIAVVNHFVCFTCLSLEEQQPQDLLADVHTFAELNQGPEGSLGQLFTICSTVSAQYPTTQMLFNLLDSNGDQYLGALFTNNMEQKESQPFLVVGHQTPEVKLTRGKLPLVFPHQWVRSCLAVSTESGLLRWVVDGVLVEDRLVDSIKQAAEIRPQVILGAFRSGGRLSLIHI